jgi:hypothetical protein
VSGLCSEAMRGFSCLLTRCQALRLEMHSIARVYAQMQATQFEPDATRCAQCASSCAAQHVVDLAMPGLLWNATEFFYSYSDEKSFFQWLESVSGVSRVEGTADGLVIHLRSSRLSKSAFYDLIAIYQRYGGDMTQLAQFIPPASANYFKSPNTYWHKAMFAKPQRKSPGRSNLSSNRRAKARHST